MVSIFTKIGGALFCYGILFGIIINMFQIPFPLVNGTYSQSNLSLPIPTDGSYIDVSLAEINHPFHPFTTLMELKSNFRCENGEVTVRIWILYSNPSLNIYGQFPWSDSSFNLHSDQEPEFLYSTMSSINGKYGSGSYELLLRVSRDIAQANTGDLYLDYTTVKVNFMLYSMFLPMFSFMGGILIVVGGLLYNYRRLTKGRGRPKGVAVDWEPSLQRGPGFSKVAEKTPKLAIKPTPTKKKTKKAAVKKPVPRTGVQHECKFCGKPIPSAAFFCPHCYSKVR